MQLSLISETNEQTSISMPNQVIELPEHIKSMAEKIASVCLVPMSQAVDIVLKMRAGDLSIPLNFFK
jgi:antitoxin component of RelBE/YafQ-DinJ toxin-antitoxin module